MRPWWIAAIAAGVALRLAMPLRATLLPDGARLSLLGRSLARGDGFATLAPGADGALAAVPSHEFPPLFPALLSLAYRAWGYSPEVTQWAGVAIGLAALPVVWLATRAVAGREAAWAVTALVAVHPRLVVAGAVGHSEELAVALYAATIAFVLASLREPRWMVAAGAAAGLAFLARSSLGWLLVLAGAAGFAWRLAHRGSRGVTEPWYLAGAALFLATVAAWTWRNVSLFWDGTWASLPAAAQSSGWAQHAQEQALPRPADFAAALALQSAVFALVLAPFALALARPLARAARRWREEVASGLWLAVALAVVLATLMGAAFALVEDEPFLLVDHERYLVVAVVPLAWLAWRERPTPREARAFLALVAALALLSAGVAAVGLDRAPALAAREVGAAMSAGDTVVVVGEPASFTLPYYVEKSPRFAENATWRIEAGGAPAGRVVIGSPLVVPNVAGLSGPLR